MNDENGEPIEVAPSEDPYINYEYGEVVSQKPGYDPPPEYPIQGTSASPYGSFINLTDANLIEALKKFNATPQLRSVLGDDVALATLLDREYALSTARQQQEYNSYEAMLARAWSREQAEIEHKWSVEEAQKARDWTAAQSATAYQRAMSDLRAAGLNPILAYSQGGAQIGSAAIASTPHANVTSASGLGYTSGTASPRSQRLDRQTQIQNTSLNALASTASMLFITLLKLALAG